MANKLSDRLEELVTEAGERADFCRKVWPSRLASVDPYEANKAKLSKWLSGQTDMGPSEARRIAHRFGRRAGWLLFGELPERRYVSRSETDIADDVAAYVSQSVAARVGTSTERMDAIDGRRLLEELTVAGVESYRASEEFWNRWNDVVQLQVLTKGTHADVRRAVDRLAKRFMTGDLFEAERNRLVRFEPITGHAPSVEVGPAQPKRKTSTRSSHAKA